MLINVHIWIFMNKTSLKRVKTEKAHYSKKRHGKIWQFSHKVLVKVKHRQIFWTMTVVVPFSGFQHIISDIHMTTWSEHVTPGLHRSICLSTFNIKVR